MAVAQVGSNMLFCSRSDTNAEPICTQSSVGGFTDIINSSSHAVDPRLCPARLLFPRLDWSEPSWNKSPFSGPKQMFHLLSYCFLAVSLAEFWRDLNRPRAPFIPAFTCVAAIAIVIGLRAYQPQNVKEEKRGRVA